MVDAVSAVSSPVTQGLGGVSGSGSGADFSQTLQNLIAAEAAQEAAIEQAGSTAISAMGQAAG